MSMLPPDSVRVPRFYPGTKLIDLVDTSRLLV